MLRRYLLASCAIVLVVGYFARGWIGPYFHDTPGSGAMTGTHAARALKSLPVTVVVARAKAGSLPNKRRAPGLVVPVASVGLSSPIAGIVVDVAAKDGADVKAGDLLARLDDRSIKASIDRDSSLLLKDQATLEDANSRLVRIKTLVPSGADSRQAEEDAEIAVKVAQASIAVSQANLAADRIQLTQTEIRAPFDGRLGVVAVSPGAYLAPGTVVATLTRMTPLYVEFTLAETHLDLIRRARAEGSLTFNAGPVLTQRADAKVTGQVVFVDDTVDAASGTFRVRALVENEKGALSPGQAMDVEIVAGEQSGLILVPTVAVQPQDDGGLCFVVKPDGTVEMRRVKIGLKVGDVTGISEGLKAGEAVVIEGQGALTNGTRVEVANVDPHLAEKALKAARKSAAP